MRRETKTMATKKLPPIPKTVWSQLGPVDIVFCSDLKARDGDEALGLWCPEERCIKLRTGMHLATAWATLEHERVHLICWDSGVGLSEDAEERIADAIGASRVAQMRWAPQS
jgi:hypothetical protein